MDNLRVVIAIVLSAVVVFFYSEFFMPTAPELSQQVSVEEKKALASNDDNNLQSNSENSTSKPAEIAVNNEVANKSVPVAATVEEYTFEGDKYRAVLSSRGGGSLKSFELKDYKKEILDDSIFVDRVIIDDVDPLPLGIAFSGRDVSLSDDSIFSIKEKTDNKVVFEKYIAEDVSIEKIFYFSPEHYKFDVEVRIINNGASSVDGSLGLSIYERFETSGASLTEYDIRRHMVRLGDNLEEEDYDDVSKEGTAISGNIDWMVLDNKYFLTAVYPEENSVNTVKSQQKEGSLVISTLERKDISVKSGNIEVIKYSVYSGPKELNQLISVGRGLEETLDLGWFHVIAEPLLRFLKLIYAALGNYGYAIILVTLIIKLLFFPLASKSYRAMEDMKKLQPQMNALKEKFKDNKDKMGKEVMNLYRKNRVNPLSGCMPMILQIPVFIALYNVLLNAIELRHAPFHFWVIDLSVKDPYYITPIVMGVTMFLQQKMSPTTPDPMQQKIMTFMPIMFTFMFLSLPAGLVLYWVVNNLLSIAQQYYIMKKAA